MGQGTYRMLPTGNAEIDCEFPDNMLMISVSAIIESFTNHIILCNFAYGSQSASETSSVIFSERYMGTSRCWHS